MSIKRLFSALGAFAITFLMIYFQFFYGLDKLVSDGLCQTGGRPNQNIYIVAIDDKTLSEYGPMNSWSREKTAELIRLLNTDEDIAPAVIGLDILFIEEDSSETGKRIDSQLAEAAGLRDNVVTAMNIQFTELPKTDDKGRIYYDKFVVAQLDYPYEALRQKAEVGFANTIVDSDGIIRRSMSNVSYKDMSQNAASEISVDSLALTVYKKYVAETDVALPATDKDGLFSFKFAARPGGYSAISMCDVLEGRVPAKLFKDSIVLVGAYAVGMQDSYVPAIAHGQQMYGVEIHANVIDALLTGATQLEADRLLVALGMAAVVAAYVLVCGRLKIVYAGVLGAFLIVAGLLADKLMYDKGLILPVIIMPVMLLVCFGIDVVSGYILEIQRRRKIVGVFKQYVAPQIVEEISKQKDFQIQLGGRRRHIAVLFVDIRGFTTMSESLPPEEVVEILNEYLALTTKSIFDNQGTLDKFVGDATMAVFNSPFDLEDYVYKAVRAAWDMKCGSEKLSQRLEEKYGRSVAFGIGVNCGDAVVGNIGCEFRMDYTAIGDTVNTAARLESNAKRGQILISQEVYDIVADRISANPIGEIPLKGKANGVYVWEVTDVRDDSEC